MLAFDAQGWQLTRVFLPYWITQSITTAIDCPRRGEGGGGKVKFLKEVSQEDCSSR